MTFLIVIIVIIIIIIGPGDNNGFYLHVLVRFLPRQPKKIIIIIYPWHFSTWCPYLPVHIIEVVIVCLSKRGVNGLVNISIDFMGCLFFLLVTLSLVEFWSWCALCYRKCKLSCAMQFTRVPVGKVNQLSHYSVSLLICNSTAEHGINSRLCNLHTKCGKGMLSEPSPMMMISR